MTVRGLRPIIVALLLLCILPVGAGAEEYEQTEHRLKSAGIEPALRTRIHTAIDRAAAFLRSRQHETGAWDSHTLRPVSASKAGAGLSMTWSDGLTALSSLALQHSGAPKAQASARRGLVHLMGPRRVYVSSSVYVAGITALLCQGFEEKDGGIRLSKGLVRGFGRRSGLWGYGTGGGPVPGVRGVNLSTSQFGCLGLWAGERLGMTSAKPVWRRHLDWLLAAQQPDGSWPYGTNVAKDWTTPRPTLAFMGMANLVLARSALRVEIAKDPALRERVLIAESRGRTAVRRYARWKLRGLTGLSTSGTAWPLYGLYALEKSAVFAGTERLGTTSWYREGALRLLALQDPDGSWDARRWPAHTQLPRSTIYHRSRVLGTAFGLLFLLRVSESHRPVTPTAPITGAPSATREAQPQPDVNAFGVLVGRVTRGLRDPDRPNDELVRLLEKLSTAYGLADDTDARVLLWKKATERVLISALRMVDVDKKTRENRRARVNVRAAQLLLPTSARVLAPVQALLKEIWGERRFDVGVDLVQICFDVLARHGTEATLQWVVDEAVLIRKSTRAWIRTGAALTSIEGYHHLPLRTRRTAAVRLAHRYVELDDAAKRVRNRPGAHLGLFWLKTRPDVLVALLDLVRSKPGDPDMDVPADASMRHLAAALERLR